MIISEDPFLIFEFQVKVRVWPLEGRMSRRNASLIVPTCNSLSKPVQDSQNHFKILKFFEAEFKLIRKKFSDLDKNVFD